MDTITIRQQLHNYLEVADDKKINALYTIIEKDIQESEFEYPDDLKNELDKRYSEYKAGSAEMVTASESKKRIEKIVKAGKEKEMSYTYILHKYAQKDYEESLEWYMQRSINATEKFVKEIDTALQLVCANPGRWRNKYKNFHEITLKKYPFTIIYTIEKANELIVVSSIYHHKRNPKVKYRKI